MVNIRHVHVADGEHSCQHPLPTPINSLLYSPTIFKTILMKQSRLPVLTLIAFALMVTLYADHSVIARQSIVLNGDANEQQTETLKLPLESKKTFYWKDGVERVIQGKATESNNGARTCKGEFPEADVIEGFTAVSTFYQNGCYTDDKYSAGNFRFQLQQFSMDEKTWYPAVRVDPPARTPQKFLASHHYLYYRFPEKKSYNIYTIKAGNPEFLTRVLATNINPAGFTRIPESDLSQLTEAKIFLIIPVTAPVSPYHQLNPHTMGAWLKDTPVGRVGRIQFYTDGSAFNLTTDYNAGPDSHENIYGTGREFFFLPSGDSAKIVWQEKSRGQLYMTTLDSKLLPADEIVLKAPNNEKLMGATMDGRGKIYTVSVKLGNAPAHRNSMIVLRRYSSDGKPEKEHAPKTTKDHLNVWSITDTYQKSKYVSDLIYSKIDNNTGVLSLVLSRTMNRSPDGLNHQGAIAAIVDPDSLNVIKNLGQLSGHSFGNYTIPLAGGRFATMDMGDNYPRGFHLHVYDQNKREDLILFNFKTLHGETPTSPARRSYPLYGEISTNNKYYQWSNDNRTYSEPGGIAKTDEGILALFSSESPDLDNTRIGGNHNDPRNLYVVHAAYPFRKKQNPSQRVDETNMLTKGPVREAGYYGFNGKFFPQRNAGARQITDYRKMSENASRPKLLRIDSDRYLVLWEKWSESVYSGTWAAIINDRGDYIEKPTSLEGSFRLGRQEDIHLYRGHVISIWRDSVQKRVEIGVIQLK